jgi:hypothetical protein
MEYLANCHQRLFDALHLSFGGVFHLPPYHDVQAAKSFRGLIGPYVRRASRSCQPHGLWKGQHNRASSVNTIASRTFQNIHIEHFSSSYLLARLSDSCTGQGSSGTFLRSLQAEDIYAIYPNLPNALVTPVHYQDQLLLS